MKFESKKLPNANNKVLHTLAYINSKSFPNLSKNVETIFQIEYLNVQLHENTDTIQSRCIDTNNPMNRHLDLCFARNDRVKYWVLPAEN